MHHSAHAGSQGGFSDVADAVDVHPSDRSVRVARDGDLRRQMEDEFRSGEGVFECAAVENVTSDELCSNARQSRTGPDVDSSHRLASGDKGPHDVGSEVPGCPRDNESHASTPQNIGDLRQWFVLPRKELQRTRKRMTRNFNGRERDYCC
jgi:hypothetical protein